MYMGVSHVHRGGCKGDFRTCWDGTSQQPAVQAQMEERLFEAQEVPGSTPGSGTAIVGRQLDIALQRMLLCIHSWWGFSGTPHSFGSIAQWLERVSYIHLVVGSIPTTPTRIGRYECQEPLEPIPTGMKLSISVSGNLPVSLDVEAAKRDQPLGAEDLRFGGEKHGKN